MQLEDTLLVELVDHTIDQEDTMGLAASVCYDADPSREKCINRVKSAVKNDHGMVLRFAYATFRISGISRVCSHQFVRVAHAGILQQSQRYVEQTGLRFIDPPALLTIPVDLQERWMRIQNEAKALYGELIGDKLMKKEDARYIIPQGCDTTLVATMNFQAWRHMLHFRTEKHAQWEIREVANRIKQQLEIIAPSVFTEV